MWDLVPDMEGLLENASFQNINVTSYVLPIGTWPKDPTLKEIGKYFRAQMVDSAIEGYTLALFTRYGKWTPMEVQVLLAHLRRELKSNKMHIYSQLYVIQEQSETISAYILQFLFHRAEAALIACTDPDSVPDHQAGLHHTPSFPRKNPLHATLPRSPRV